MQHRWKPLLAPLCCLMVSPLSNASWRVDLEGGAVWAAHNDVQIPNDSSGDRFDISELGSGPYPLFRASLAWRPWANHEFQLVAAPLFYEEEGEFSQDVRFAGATYTGGQTTRVNYQFNSYRLRYLYALVDATHWQLELGGTLFVRDAKIELRQDGVQSEDSNIGVVPLFALKASYRFLPRWSLLLDSDLAFASQGRAVDMALLLRHELSERWHLGFGYRTVEGGADNDDVYTFSWFNAAVVNVSYSWQ